VVINLVLDNGRVLIPLVDGIQTLHLLFYMQIWYHPLLGRFLLGFRVATLRVPGIASLNQQWNCDAKSHIVYGGCSLFS
jgi:hypothetical protein